MGTIGTFVAGFCLCLKTSLWTLAYNVVVGVNKAQQLAFVVKQKFWQICNSDKESSLESTWKKFACKAFDLGLNPDCISDAALTHLRTSVFYWKLTHAKVCFSFRGNNSWVCIITQCSYFNCFLIEERGMSLFKHTNNCVLQISSAVITNTDQKQL